MCMERQFDHIPERWLVQECAAEYGMEFSKLNDCASKEDGAYGIGLLRDSVSRSKSAGVTLSCTVRLNDNVRCIRDGGKWKNCDGGFEPDNLIGDVESLYKKMNEF